MEPTPKELRDLYSPLLGVVPGLETIDCGNEYAAAMCRVAVEDWMVARAMRRGHYIRLDTTWSGKDFEVVEEILTEGERHEYHRGEGPTIHHALVAAATAVAKARG